MPPDAKYLAPKIFLGSELVKNLEEELWLVSKIPDNFNTAQLLFSTRKHFFSSQMWVNSGLGKERTITIMKSSANRVFGGYMNIRWEK